MLISFDPKRFNSINKIIPRTFSSSIVTNKNSILHNNVVDNTQKSGGNTMYILACCCCCICCIVAIGLILYKIKQDQDKRDELEKKVNDQNPI
jgi:hypothetical protein